MKIEIRKEVDWESTWYWTYKDNRPDHCFYSLEDAEKCFKYLVENAKKTPVIEVIESEEV